MLGYFAITNPNHNYKGCGWLTWHVRHVPPTISVEAMHEEQAFASAAAKVDTPLFINGREVILVAKN
jgi:hypothetical protein